MRRPRRPRWRVSSPWTPPSDEKQRSLRGGGVMGCPAREKNRGSGGRRKRRPHGEAERDQRAHAGDARGLLAPLGGRQVRAALGDIALGRRTRTVQGLRLIERGPCLLADRRRS